MEVGILGPPLASTAGIIIMAEHNETILQKDLLSVFFNFDFVTYSYFFTSLFLCSVLVHFVHLYSRRKKKDSTFFIHPNHLNLEVSKYLNQVWKMLSATCCHYSYHARENSLKFTWGALIVGIAFLLQFVGRNLISSDLVVVIKEPHPETVQELLSPQFSHLDVQILGQLQLNTLIDKGYRLHGMKDRINSKKSNILTEVSVDVIRGALDSIRYGQSVILMEEYVFLNFKSYICYLNTSYGVSLHFAKEKVAEGYGHVIYSSKTHPRLVHFLDYRYRTALEMGTYRNFVEKESPAAVFFYLSVEIKFNNLKCMDFHKDRTDPKFKPYGFQDVAVFFSLCLFWLTVAATILFLENIFLKTCEKIYKFLGFENVIEEDKVVRKRFKYRNKEIA